MSYGSPCSAAIVYVRSLQTSDTAPIADIETFGEELTLEIHDTHFWPVNKKCDLQGSDRAVLGG